MPYREDRRLGIVVGVLEAGDTAFGGSWLHGLQGYPRTISTLLAVLTVVAGCIGIYAGFKIMDSKRIGFTVASWMAVVQLVPSLYRLGPDTIVQLAFSAWILWRCRLRLSGNRVRRRTPESAISELRILLPLRFVAYL